MVNYREILRLQSLGYSQRQIASSVRSSRDTVSQVCRLATIHGLEWPLPDEMTNHVIQETFFPAQLDCNSRRIPDYAKMHKELAKPGVTLTLLWAEYCETCYAENATPYQYTQFCDNYRKWARVTKATMRIKRKPGDTFEVDWAGNTMPIYDRVTGEQCDAYIFVGVLPCSGYAYVEAFPSMVTENWITAHVNAYNYFGGVTRIVIPDNLKTGVIKNSRYDTVLNRSYSEMAAHYDTAIVPARVNHPQDKPNVEGTVNHTATWICAALRNEKFFSLQELNEAIFTKLEELNSKPFQKRRGSRLSAFLEEEKSFLKPLPASPYELAVWSTATVRSDYLITDGKNKYSVPFDLIGEEVHIRLTSRTIEAFFNGSRVASYPRETVQKRDPIVKVEHMPDNHKKYLMYNEEAFSEWASSIGPNTLAVVQQSLRTGTVAEQGFKACASLMKLADRYGHVRLENACARSLVYTPTPNIKTINTVLRTGHDKIEQQAAATESAPGSRYGFTRGAAYFGGEKDD